MNRTTYLFLVLGLLISIITLPARTLSAQTASDSTGTNQPSAIDPTDLSFEMEQVKKEFNKIEIILEPDAALAKTDTLFRKYKIFLQKEAKAFHSYNPNNLSKFFLENTYRSWEGFMLKLQIWQTEINVKHEIVQQNISTLDKIKLTWTLTLESKSIKEEPIEIIDKIKNIINTSKSVRKKLQHKNHDLILLEEEISEMSSFCDDIIIHVTVLQQHLRDSVFIAVAAPLWKVKVTKSDYTPVLTRLSKSWHENAKTIRNYFNTGGLTSFFVLLFQSALHLLFPR